MNIIKDLAFKILAEAKSLTNKTNSNDIDKKSINKITNKIKNYIDEIDAHIE